jgi:hypothetical protein
VLPFAVLIAEGSTLLMNQHLFDLFVVSAYLMQMVRLRKERIKKKIFFFSFISLLSEMDSITYRFIFSRHVLIQMPIRVLGAYALKDLVCVGKLRSVSGLRWPSG